MAFSSGIATDQNDLLDEFRAFALADGWTINSFVADNSSRGTGTGTSGQRLHISKNGMFFNFRSSDGANVIDTSRSTSLTDTFDRLFGIAVVASTGYNGAQPWETQPGHAPWPATITGVFNWSCNYWFFSTTESLTMAVEYDPVGYPGRMAFMHVGRMIPNGQTFAVNSTDGMTYAASTRMDQSFNGGSSVNFNNWNNAAANFLGSSNNNAFGHGATLLGGLPQAGGGTYGDIWVPHTVRTSVLQEFVSQYTIIFSGPRHADTTSAINSMFFRMLQQGSNDSNGVTPFFPVYAMLYDNGLNGPRKPYIHVGYIDGVRHAAHPAFTLGGQTVVGANTFSSFPLWYKDATQNIAGFVFQH